MFIAIAIAAVALVILMMGIQIYNGLVSLKNQVDRSWANIDVILKQRFDEIPQLVKVVEQFANYERGTIDRLVQARQKYGSAQQPEQKIEASQEMSLALRGIFAIGENYPELRSNQNFVQLQTRVSALEDALADRREHYNESVTNLNTRIEQIPDSFFANMLGYRQRPMFNVPESEKARPDLTMNLPT